MNARVFKDRIYEIKDKLFRLALSIVGNEEEAEDIVQDALIKVWTSLSKSKINNLEAWSMRITKNTALDVIKSYRRKNTESLVSTAIYHISSGNSPYENTEIRDTINSVQLIMRKLPEKQKLVLQLRDFEGYSYSDICEILEITETDAKTSLSRARKNIRENLTKLESFGR